jgi:multiple sugar transport system ATP-binding protein
VYQRPANRFVAGFVGMPPMNFLEGTVVTEKGELWFDEGSGRIALPAWAHAALGRRVGSRVAMGVRPQAISDAPFAGAGQDSGLDAKVDVVEFLGDKTEVYVSTPRHPHVIAHLDATRGLTPNARVRLHLDPQRLQFFETDPVGQTIASPPAAS